MIAKEETLAPCLARVIESRCFEKAPTLRNLLIYLWEHRDDPISEYAVATGALGRSASFDPKTDATVRVQISRLRQRLAKFYEEEGRDLTERLAIPLGSHQVQLRLTPVEELPAEQSRIRRPRSRALLALALGCGALLVISAAFAVALFRERAASAPKAVAPAFWKTFFDNARPTRLILPTPVFFHWVIGGGEEGHSLMFRDTEINDYRDHGKSPQVALFGQQFGPPQLAASYTVTSDTFAAVRLERFLDHVGFEINVLSSASAPLEALDRENVIALGTWGTLTPLKPYLDRMNFVMSTHEESVRNRNPLRGEPHQIDKLAESRSRITWPGIIALLPGHNNQTRLLLLASRHTAALVSFLTSSNGLDQLRRLWKENKSPEFYEVVVNSEIDNESPVRSWPVILRAYKPDSNTP